MSNELRKRGQKYDRINTRRNSSKKSVSTIMALGNFGTFEQLPDWLQQAIIQSESPSTDAGYEEVPSDES